MTNRKHLPAPATLRNTPASCTHLRVHPDAVGAAVPQLLPLVQRGVDALILLWLRRRRVWGVGVNGVGVLSGLDPRRGCVCRGSRRNGEARAQAGVWAGKESERRGKRSQSPALPPPPHTHHNKTHQSTQPTPTCMLAACTPCAAAPSAKTRPPRCGCAVAAGPPSPPRPPPKGARLRPGPHLHSEVHLRREGLPRQLAQHVGRRRHAKGSGGGAQHWDGADAEVGHHLRQQAGWGGRCPA
jgi:hypothetical protein